MKKVIFKIQIDNIIDIITNSSSELFILKGKERETIVELLNEVYPDWRNEYDDVKNITELSANELDTYFSYECSPHCYPATKEMYPVLDGFTFDELYETDGKEKAWNGSYQYKLKNNKKDSRSEWDYSFVTEENREDIINRISPNKDLWFLYSLDENPNWEYQERLMEVGERIHMG